MQTLLSIQANVSGGGTQMESPDRLETGARAVAARLKAPCNPEWPRYTEKVACECFRRLEMMAGPVPDRIANCGSSSGVEHHVANVVVVGSNPISRSCVSPSWVGRFRSSA
jgi:hypothetical protein